MSKRKPMVERTRRLSGRMLAFLLSAEEDTLREFASVSKSGRAAKTLVKEGALRLTLVALRKDTSLPSHHVPGPVSIQTLRGCLRIGAGTNHIDLTAGGLVVLDAGVEHTARALADTAILLTVIM